MTHLDALEAEAIYIMREVAAECEKRVMLYSIGKDSSVMLHLAMKAFYPEKPPFPFLHVNTTWKFREMYFLSPTRSLPVFSRHAILRSFVPGKVLSRFPLSFLIFPTCKMAGKYFFDLFY